MTARFVETLPLERLGKLLVGQDPFVDQVLAQRLNGRRLAEDPAKRVDEVDRAERLLQNRVGPLRVVTVGPDGAIYFLTDTALGTLSRVNQ